MRDFLYDDGILRVPIVVEDAGVKTFVFTYSKHDKDAAAHYSGVRSVLRSREQATAVYYGPEALASAKPGVVLQPIDTPFFSKDDESKDGDFALWWATPEAPRFADSEERAFLDRWFESLDGYGFLILTAFLRGLELAEGKDNIYALPAQPLLQPVIGPGDTRMLLHASDGKASSWPSKRGTTPSRRRLAAAAAGRLRVPVSPRDRAPRGSRPAPRRRGRASHAWFAIRDAALAKEERERDRAHAARGDGERRAAAARPERERRSGSGGAAEGAATRGSSTQGWTCSLAW